MLVAAVAALATAAAARADGDPASDFLYTGTLYPSFVSPPSDELDGELRGLLEVAKDRGYPLKVALIVDRQDLGQYPELFDKPQRYATLLASELAIFRKLRAPVLVVTTAGLAVSGSEERHGKLVPVTPARGKVLLQGLSAPDEAKGDAFAGSAIAAVRQLARLDGHPLPTHVTPVAGPNTPAPADKPRTIGTWLIVGIVAALFFLSWLVFELVATIRERRAKAAAAPD